MDNPESGGGLESGAESIQVADIVDNESQKQNPVENEISDNAPAEGTAEVEVQDSESSAVEGGSPDDKAAKLEESRDNHEERLALSEEISELEGSLAADIEALGKISPSIRTSDSDSLAMDREIKYLIEKKTIVVEAKENLKRDILKPPEGSALVNRKKEVYYQKVKEVEMLLIENKEKLRAAREKYLEEWIEECIEAALEQWNSYITGSENADDAKAIIRLEIEYYIKDNSYGFIEGTSTELPGWSGQITTYDVETEDGVKTYVTDITIGPYSESLDDASEGSRENSEKPEDEGLAEAA